MSELSELMDHMASIEDTLTDIETHLDPLLLKEMEDMQGRLGHLDQAKLHVGLAYTLDTLFFMYLKTRGTEVDDHPIKQELARVKTYIEKISKASNPKHGKPKQQIDTAAAGRFVGHALSGNQ